MNMSSQPERSVKFMAETREQWILMSFYDRFEHIVAIILSIVIVAVISIALIQLLARVTVMIMSGPADPLEYEVFQSLFGRMVTLLIALEFKHSIIRVALRRESIVQVKTVLLISLIALSRKFIILDFKTTDAQTIIALAVATLVLGVVYWLLRERDDRLVQTARTAAGSE
jgi:uncharacterized membrane protein (DUF373 family)